MKFNKFFPIFFLALALFAASCTEDSLPGPDVPDPGTGMEIDTSTNNFDGTLWLGSTVNFSKNAGSDPDAAANQDRLTDNVWLTRGNNGGQIFNAVVENSASKSASPRGTQWAVGTIDNVANLEFKNFRAAVGSPQSVVGRNLVLHLVDDNIYLSVRFTSWSQSKSGGFAYERSSP